MKGKKKDAVKEDPVPRREPTGEPETVDMTGLSDSEEEEGEVPGPPSTALTNSSAVRAGRETPTYSISSLKSDMPRKGKGVPAEKIKQGKNAEGAAATNKPVQGPDDEEEEKDQQQQAHEVPRGGNHQGKYSEAGEIRQPNRGEQEGGNVGRVVNSETGNQQNEGDLGNNERGEVAFNGKDHEEEEDCDQNRHDGAGDQDIAGAFEDFARPSEQGGSSKANNPQKAGGYDYEGDTALNGTDQVEINGAHTSETEDEGLDDDSIENRLPHSRKFKRLKKKSATMAVDNNEDEAEHGQYVAHNADDGEMELEFEGTVGEIGFDSHSNYHASWETSVEGESDDDSDARRKRKRKEKKKKKKKEKKRKRKFDDMNGYYDDYDGPEYPEQLDDLAAFDPLRKKKKKHRRHSTFLKGPLFYDVSVPTENELALHSKMNIHLADFAVKSTDVTPIVCLSRFELQASWESMVRKKRTEEEMTEKKRGFRDITSLKLRISIKKDTREPVLIRYDQVEPADDTAENYGYIKKKSSSKFQHALFTGESKFLFDHSGPALFDDSCRTRLDHSNVSVSERSEEEAFHDDRPQIEEWFPKDPYEYILNDWEGELVWLFEESLHVFGGNSDESLEWDYIWEYASPGLKVELRSCGGDGKETKYNSLVRWNDPLVAGRMKVVRQFVRDILRKGFRRPHMKRVLAVLRLHKPCDVHGKRLYPTPDFEAANSTSHYNALHFEALRAKQGSTSDADDEDGEWIANGVDEEDVDEEIVE